MSQAYAVIKTGGKQYRVTSGSSVTVEKLDGEVGASITFSEVLLTSNGSENGIKLGAPFVKGAEVTGKIVAQKRAPKLIIYKKNRRKGYTKKQGHRQSVTQVLIENVG
jgi:large subunit ribosomal protein L21